MGSYDYAKDRRLALGRRRRDQVAEHYGLRPGDLIGRSRTEKVCRARHVAAWMLRREDGFRLGEIGEMLGGRDHTTVLNAIRVIDTALQYEPDTTVAVMQIAERPLPCVHIWLIDKFTSAAPSARGRCRVCGDERQFSKTVAGAPVKGTNAARRQALSGQHMAAEASFGSGAFPGP